MGARMMCGAAAAALRYNFFVANRSDGFPTLGNSDALLRRLFRRDGPDRATPYISTSVYALRFFLLHAW